MGISIKPQTESHTNDLKLLVVGFYLCAIVLLGIVSKWTLCAFIQILLNALAKMEAAPTIPYFWNDKCIPTHMAVVNWRTNQSMPPRVLSHSHSEQTLKFCKHGGGSNCVRLLVSHHRRLLVCELFGCWHKHADNTGCWQQAGFSGPWVSSKNMTGE